MSYPQILVTFLKIVVAPDGVGPYTPLTDDEHGDATKRRNSATKRSQKEVGRFLDK